MDKINAGIVSFYMDNIHPDAIAAQRDVVAKFNKSGHPHYQIQTGLRHGHSMDAAWLLNGTPVKSPVAPNIVADRKPWDHAVLMFLDIDALPLNDQAIDSYIEQAYNGSLVGNIQRSNHIQNNQHTFVAPSAMAISESTFLTIGQPSAVETYRSDVGEEYTWLCEAKGIRVTRYMPLSFDAKPFAPPGHPEVDSWALADGQPVYGIGTTFGLFGVPEFWHMFQSFYPGQNERFMAKCKQLLEKTDG
jgi:hypothetical protein